MPDDAIAEIKKPDNEKFRNTATTSATTISFNTSSASNTSDVYATTKKAPLPFSTSTEAELEIETTAETTTTYIPGKGRTMIVLLMFLNFLHSHENPCKLIFTSFV